MNFWKNLNGTSSRNRRRRWNLKCRHNALHCHGPFEHMSLWVCRHSYARIGLQFHQLRPCSVFQPLRRDTTRSKDFRWNVQPCSNSRNLHHWRNSIQRLAADTDDNLFPDPRGILRHYNGPLLHWRACIPLSIWLSRWMSPIRWWRVV